MTILFDDIQNLIGLESIHVEEQVGLVLYPGFFLKISGLHVPWSCTFHRQVIYLSVCTLRMKLRRTFCTSSLTLVLPFLEFPILEILTVTRHVDLLVDLHKHHSDSESSQVPKARVRPISKGRYPLTVFFR